MGARPCSSERIAVYGCTKRVRRSIHTGAYSGTVGCLGTPTTVVRTGFVEHAVGGQGATRTIEVASLFINFLGLARLVRDGLCNPEIGARLLLSP